MKIHVFNNFFKNKEKILIDMHTLLPTKDYSPYKSKTFFQIPSNIILILLSKFNYDYYGTKKDQQKDINYLLSNVWLHDNYDERSRNMGIYFPGDLVFNSYMEFGNIKKNEEWYGIFKIKKLISKNKKARLFSLEKKLKRLERKKDCITRENILTFLSTTLKNKKRIVFLTTCCPIGNEINIKLYNWNEKITMMKGLFNKSQERLELIKTFYNPRRVSLRLKNIVPRNKIFYKSSNIESETESESDTDIYKLNTNIVIHKNNYICKMLYRNILKKNIIKLIFFLTFFVFVIKWNNINIIYKNDF